MDWRDAWRTRLKNMGAEEIQSGLDTRRISERKAVDARAELAMRERKARALAEEAAYVFPPPPKSRFRLSENIKATIVLMAQIVAAMATAAAAVIAYLSWVSPRLPH